MKGSGKQENPKNTSRSAASTGTIPACENPGANRPGIEHGLPMWEVISLTTTPLRPLLRQQHITVGELWRRQMPWRGGQGAAHLHDDVDKVVVDGERRVEHTADDVHHAVASLLVLAHYGGASFNELAGVYPEWPAKSCAGLEVPLWLPPRSSRDAILIHFSVYREPNHVVETMSGLQVAVARNAVITCLSEYRKLCYARLAMVAGKGMRVLTPQGTGCHPLVESVADVASDGWVSSGFSSITLHCTPSSLPLPYTSPPSATVAARMYCPPPPPTSPSQTAAKTRNNRSVQPTAQHEQLILKISTDTGKTVSKVRHALTRITPCSRKQHDIGSHLQFQSSPPVGATVAERLACSPTTNAIQVKSPARSPWIFACGDCAGRCRWSAGFLGDLPFPPPFHSGVTPHSPQSPLSALKTSMLRAVQISSLTHIPYPCHRGVERFGRLLTTKSWKSMRVSETRWMLSSARMPRRGKREIPEKTRRPVASSGAIPQVQDSRERPRPGTESGSPRRTDTHAVGVLVDAQAVAAVASLYALVGAEVPRCQALVQHVVEQHGVDPAAAVAVQPRLLLPGNFADSSEDKLNCIHVYKCVLIPVVHTLLDKPRKTVNQ
ncbi:hypothetical protein PR048_014498 [Dryococelus australis]|uniref:Uncharacterized protein n=1 Tax=Dryococelus australis TaxID=614101 RepID=A0ABQ9HED4_9NEOP|nr:hypothetical protein PR048_014498 [Dryococelus australis]